MRRGNRRARGGGVAEARGVRIGAIGFQVAHSANQVGWIGGVSNAFEAAGDEVGGNAIAVGQLSEEPTVFFGYQQFRQIEPRRLAEAVGDKPLVEASGERWVVVVIGDAHAGRAIDHQGDRRRTGEPQRERPLGEHDEHQADGRESQEREQRAIGTPAPL